jgi:hypothetical protein
MTSLKERLLDDMHKDVLQRYNDGYAGFISASVVSAHIPWMNMDVAERLLPVTAKDVPVSHS